MVAKNGTAAKRASDAGNERPRAGRGLRSINGAAESTGAEEQTLLLDRLIHERLRLGIVSALAVNDSLTFNDLKKLLRTTDGNLSVHARRLEEAQYVTCT